MSSMFKTLDQLFQYDTYYRKEWNDHTENMNSSSLHAMNILVIMKLV